MLRVYKQWETVPSPNSLHREDERKIHVSAVQQLDYYQLIFPQTGTGLCFS